jgi:hypothetical protein
MLKYLFAASLGVFLIGCNTPENKTDPLVFVAGRTVPRSAVLTVRDKEIVKVYQTGRYVDPSNRNIMHEAGQMYVISRSPTWNTRPNSPVHTPGFVNRLPINKSKPVNIQLENLRKQQALLAQTNQAMRSLGTQMLKGREEIKKVDSSADKAVQLKEKFEDLKKEQSKIVRKLAELETLKFNSAVSPNTKINN